MYTKKTKLILVEHPVPNLLNEETIIKHPEENKLDMWCWASSEDWESVLLYLVSDENIDSNDKEVAFLINNEWVIACPGDLMGDQIQQVLKIVAEPHQIGLKYVKYKMDTYGQNNLYTTDLCINDFQDIMDNGGNCEVYMEEALIKEETIDDGETKVNRLKRSKMPILIDNKVIILIKKKEELW